MRCTFTDYVRGAVGEECFADVLRSLRNLLVQELKRRDLWNVPPRYLGVLGGDGWEDGDLLEELVLDCFEHVFVRRLPGLRNQVRVHAAIDGLVVLNVRHFLHDTQRAHDPLGYRIFEITRDAVQSLLDAGTLFRSSDEEGLRNDTLLGRARWVSDPAIRPPDPDLIRAWNNHLMPDLVTAWHRERVVDDLAACIAGLDREAFPVFRFRDLVGPLKDDARARWLALVREGEELARDVDAPAGHPLLTPVFLPRHSLEEEQGYRELLACIARGIEGVPRDERSRAYLRRLLAFLRQWAASGEGSGAGALPPDSRIGEMLQIPRGRLSDLKGELGGLARECRRPGGRIHAEARTMNTAERRERLHRLSAEAFESAPEAPPPGSALEVGAALVFSGTESGLEWLVVSRDSGGRALLIPLDALPLVGGSDLDLADEVGEPLIARCGFPVRLAVDRLGAGLPVRQVGSPVIRKIREKLAAVESGAVAPTLFEREAEADSAYRSWGERLRAARRQVQAPLRTAPPLPAPRRRGWRTVPPAYALAAALACTVVGLSFWVQDLRRRVGQGTEPILIPSGSAEEIRLGSAERGLEARLVAAGKQHALLYLVFRDVPEAPRYVVRLISPGGTVVWQSREFPRGEQVLIVPLTHEPAFRSLQLLGLRADGSTIVLDERPLVPVIPAL